MNTNSNLNSKSFTRIPEEELYSTHYVDSLLSGVNDWRNIQEIVRSTFKALTEVVRAQGSAIKELEKHVNTKASKSELINSLTTKANTNDVMRTFNEVAASMENRPTVDELHELLDSKISKNDFNYLINSKPSIDEVRNMISTKFESLNNKEELELELKTRIEEQTNYINKRLNSYISNKELNNVLSILETKANLAEVSEQIANKASKESVVSALQRKMNKSEVEAIINSKADITDFQNLSQIVKNKADIIETEEIRSILDTKTDRNELLQLTNLLNNKIDFKDYELLQNTIIETKNDTTKRITDIDSDLDRLIDNIKKEFSNWNSLITQLESTKLDLKDLEAINNNIAKKIDSDNLNYTINQLKTEISETLKNLKDENLFNKKIIEDKINDKSEFLEKQNEKINENLNGKINRISEEVSKINNDFPEFNTQIKNLVTNQNKDLLNDVNYLKDEILKFSGDIEDLYNIKAEKKDFDLLQNKVFKDLESKTSVSSLDNLYRNIMKDVSDKQDDSKSIVNKALKNFETDMFKLLDKKADLFELTNMLNNKADFASTSVAIQNKASCSEVEKIRNAVEKLIKDIGGKIDLSKFELFVKDNKRIIEDINKDLLGRASIKEVVAMMKNKADIDDVNKALSQIHEELDSKCEINNVSIYNYQY